MLEVMPDSLLPSLALKLVQKNQRLSYRTVKLHVAIFQLDFLKKDTVCFTFVNALCFLQVKSGQNL